MIVIFPHPAIICTMPNWTNFLHLRQPPQWMYWREALPGVAVTSIGSEVALLPTQKVLESSAQRAIVTPEHTPHKTAQQQLPECMAGWHTPSQTKTNSLWRGKLHHKPGINIVNADCLASFHLLCICVFLLRTLFGTSRHSFTESRFAVICSPC